MKAVRLLTHAFAENFMKVGRTTMEYAKNRLRMLLGAAVVLSAGQIAMASPDAGPDKASTADPSAAMQVPPGYTGIGPVEQGSVLFDNIPAKSRKFLQKNCDGHAIVKCDKQFASGDYEISLADGIDMEFDAKGPPTDIPSRRSCCARWCPASCTGCWSITDSSRAWKLCTVTVRVTAWLFPTRCSIPYATTLRGC